jgi:uncharacterized protein YlxW (UPF0749 family)
MNKTDYKNKLVLEIVKEIKEIEEKKALEEKKAKIKQMLSIISGKESKIEKLKEEIKNVEKDVADLKIQLDKEDFSSLSKEYDLLSLLYGGTIPSYLTGNITITNTTGGATY